MLSCEPTHQGTLAHRGESNEPNTGNTSPRDIETRTATTATTIPSYLQALVLLDSLAPSTPLPL